MQEQLTEYLNEEVDALEPDELVVVRVDAEAKEESGVAAVHKLVVAELYGDPRAVSCESSCTPPPVSVRQATRNAAAQLQPSSGAIRLARTRLEQDGCLPRRSCSGTSGLSARSCGGPRLGS